MEFSSDLKEKKITFLGKFCGDSFIIGIVIFLGFGNLRKSLARGFRYEIEQKTEVMGITGKKCGFQNGQPNDEKALVVLLLLADGVRVVVLVFPRARSSSPTQRTRYPKMMGSVTSKLDLVKGI